MRIHGCCFLFPVSLACSEVRYVLYGTSSVHMTGVSIQYKCWHRDCSSPLSALLDK